MKPEFDDEIEVIENVGSSGRPGRAGRAGRVRVPRVALGFAAIGLVGVLAGRSLLFGGAGTSSPEDAVDALAAAISEEDMVAALGTLVPEEVGPLVDVYSDAAAKANELAISGTDGTFAGVDLGVDGLQLAVEPIGDDLAKVRIRRGTFRWRVDRTQMGVESGVVLRAGSDAGGPLGAATSGSFSASDLSHEDSDHDRDPFLMVLRRNGRWYVSPAYTAAELFVVRTGIPRADLSRPTLEGAVAPSPSDAVRRLAAAVNRDDVSAGIATTSSPEWASLRTYRDAIADVVGDLTIGRNQALEVDDLRLEEQPVDATHVKVLIRGAEGTIRRDISNDYFLVPESSSRPIGPGQPRSAPMTRTRTWSFDGGCLEVDGTPEACVGDPLGGLSLWKPLGLATMETPYLIVVAERGGWAISPVATVASYARALIASLGPDDLVALAGREVEQEPTVELAAGRSTEVDVGSKGFGVASLVVPGGSVVSVTGDARPDERFTIATYRSPTDPDPTTSVVSADRSDPSEEDRLEFLAPTETTTYRVVVADHRGGASSVGLRVEDLSPRSLTLGQSIDDRLDESVSARYFEFDGAADQAVKPSMVVRVAGRNPVDGAGLVRTHILDMSTGEPVLGRTLPTTGRYLVEVVPVLDSSGAPVVSSIDFTLQVEEARATFWESGTPTVSVLTIPGRDTYVNVSMPGVGTFRVSGEAAGPFELSGDCDGGTLTVDADGASATIVADPPTTECYVDVLAPVSSSPTHVTLNVGKAG